LIKNKLNLRLFFPNGLRGDRLTPGDIDLMVEAGTRGINLSLETASPRLQKLIKKNLDIDKFKQVMDYIAAKHPEVILEIATMHGFPGETQEEALMTLDFIKSIRWIHFPYIHILKIYPNTEMEALALQHGISREDIMASKDLAYHELPETLPFPKSFTRKYQTDFMNDYFLHKDRLKHVLPVQLNVLSQDAMLQKYNAYLPTKINTPGDILKLADMEMTEMNDPGITLQEREAGGIIPEIFENPPGIKDDDAGKKKIMLLDLSQHFNSSDESMLYNVVEQPLGLIYLLTYIRQQLGDKITGKIYKAGNDFDSFPELKDLVDTYRPDLVGIRTLTYYKEFFHETAALLRQWGVTAPIIAGGPYATSDYHTILKDGNIDLAVYGEGEYTVVELLGKMLETDFKIPGESVLRKIPGLVFAKDITSEDQPLEVIQVDIAQESILREETTDLEPFSAGENLAYVMYTSGSTGKPKGVMVEHRQVNNCLCWMQDMFALTETSVVVQRTNLTFDPSVWEIFWPLHKGAAVKIIDDARRRDAAYLIEMLSKNHDLTVMYCPSTLLSAMAHYLDLKEVKPRLKLPWLIIGAEPVTMEVVKTFYSCFEGRIVNTYGPTEGTINNTYYELDPGDSRSIVPIGKPVANNRLYILSTDLKLLPIGTAGEICIAGASVSRGYINNREKTSAHFIPNPFGPGKLYKTGDIGRWLADGNIEIMGRGDNQVKIRGHRIELGEIEAALSPHPSILDTVVVARTAKELKEDIRECKTCGIWSNYPGIRINDENVCNICENLTHYKQLINRYFKTPEDFELKLREGNRDRKGKYDCLLVYACERVATYALYKLLDMGFKVLTVTYDSGHYEKASMDRIKRITSQIGVDHILLTHPNSDKILKESLRTAKTMCKGCIHTSTSLAGQYAYQNDIKYVIGETLSRGQIVENKLFKFLDMGIHDVQEIEQEVERLMRSVASLDKNIFDQINIDIVNDGSMYDKVEFIDFYRYFDISNEEMAAYLDEKDSYWKNLENRAAYSTDCKICEVGDFNHFKELGYHYTGSAKSWEKRLGLATMREVKEDLKLAISAEEHAEFLNKLGYKEELPVAEDQKYICAYYVPAKELDKAVLRTYLAAKLPDYMVPTYFVRLENIPLNSNGKIDRKKLPGLEILVGGGDSIAPRNVLEEKLVKIWENILDNEILCGSIGIDDNFFELGGHSLRATVMVSKIHKELNVQIPLAEVFKRSTIRGLSEYISNAAEERYEAIRPVEAKEYYELSFAQKRLYVLQHMQKDNLSYNMPTVVAAEGNLEKGKLEQVLKKLIKRHENLRTSFEMIQQQPIQRIHQNIDFTVDYYERNEEAARELVKTFVRPFDLGKIPLLRVRMVKVGDTKYLLMYDMHHIISDGTSKGIFIREFMASYEGKELPPLRIQYKDFSGWQHRREGIETVKKQEQYWLNEFAGDVPVLNLPTDYERPAILTAEGNSLFFEIDIEETKLLKKMALEAGATLYMVLLALFNVLLSRVCDQEDITVGAPIAGRRHSDLEPLIGFFINTLALRNFPTREKTFREFLLEIKQKTLMAFENQDYQFEELVDKVLKDRDRESNRNSLVDAVFVFQNVVIMAGEIPEVTIPGLTLKPYIENIQASPFDLILNGSESGEKLTFSFLYRTKLFKEETVQMLIRNFKEVVTIVLDNQNIRLKNIEISHDLMAVEPVSVQEDEGDFKF
jgi:amino acid adenylation domain-containing protein